MKKILFFILCFANLALFSARAENFYIKNYNIDIDVSSTKKLHIIENIDAYFTQQSHGIIRSIPLKNNIEREDGTKYIGYASVQNLKANEQYSTSRNNNDLDVKIGNPEKYVNADHYYSIQYDYQLPFTNTDEKDEFYFNIVGTQWNTTIEKVYFRIVMPKDFPYEDIGISIGSYGTKGFKDRAVIKIDSMTNTISGYTTEKLNPNEAITIRIELPPDYFLKKDKSYQKYIVIGMSILLALAMYFLWYVIGRDNKVVPVVNFTPPKGASSAEVGVMYKDYADTKEIVSLIIYLASKGYLRINNFKDSFTIEKIEDYDGKKAVEKELMDSLFPHGGGNTVSETQLKYSKTFYLRCATISAKLTEGMSKYIFDADSISKSTLFMSLFLLAGIIGLYLWALFGYEPLELNRETILICTVYMIILYVISSTMQRSKFARIFVFLFAAVALPMFFMILGTNQIIFNSDNISAVAASIMALIASFVCNYQMRKRNELGNKLLGDILGFKKFLRTAEAPRIKAFVKENPMYCYDLLPYAYVLDVTKQWIENFEKIINYKPLWYSGNFNYHSIKRLTSGLTYITKPSYENGGIKRNSSGGGGFAGGGFGGGGGRSW